MRPRTRASRVVPPRPSWPSPTYVPCKMPFPLSSEPDWQADWCCPNLVHPHVAEATESKIGFGPLPRGMQLQSAAGLVLRQRSQLLPQRADGRHLLLRRDTPPLAARRVSRRHGRPHRQSRVARAELHGMTEPVHRPGLAGGCDPLPNQDPLHRAPLSPPGPRRGDHCHPSSDCLVLTTRAVTAPSTLTLPR